MLLFLGNGLCVKAKSMKRVIFIFILFITISFSKATNSTLFPNPATTEFTVKVDSGKEVKTLDVYNYLGLKIENIEYFHGLELVANITKLKRGRYLVSINYWDGSRDVLTLIKK
jgi:hypothetical protein|tara:strand:- start:1728 stop:2069 length:342 start_codon:yes stop_codon:yes gene_type:complete